MSDELEQAFARIKKHCETGGRLPTSKECEDVGVVFDRWDVTPYFVIQVTKTSEYSPIMKFPVLDELSMRCDM